MMQAVRYFDTITLAQVPREAIYRRLGFRRSSTRMSSRQQKETGSDIQNALDLIRLQGAVLRLPFHVESAGRVVLPEDIVFTSINLATFLKDSAEILLMGATAGEAVMEAIRRDTSGDHVTRAVVMDATASETVDAALDWIMSYLNQGLRREGKTLLKTRYSAGYGDLALENQRVIYKLLGMDRMGVAITDSCILVPEKSVTALTGIVA
ncbi:MAG: hypothetical protein CSYNP_01171 [Syntrophus sp. SKADARSKE-3]|nr:hypothetical protein [Syntrophus sp. SKADARSKE-3]